MGNSTKKKVLGVICGALALFAVAVSISTYSLAEDTSSGDRCPATSKSKCDGLFSDAIGV